MTPQEALKIRKNPHFEDVDNEELSRCIDEALEKQIPKKPIKSDRQEIRYTLTYDCPTCGRQFTGTGFADYCYHCGQALDWSADKWF